MRKGVWAKRFVCAFIVACLLLCTAVLPVLAESTLTSSKTTLSGAGKNKKHNISLAIASIDGTVVDGDGGYFSFNDVVGPRTSSYGYKNALNGRGVKVTGGGVAQVASTLYLALQDMDGISFDEVETYSAFTDNYVSSKHDAILVDYKAGTDFSFYNDSGITLRIDMWTSGDYVHCSLTSDAGSSGSSSSSSPGYASISLSGGDAMVSNISLAADSIYDMTLTNGDVFSFNGTVGPRTQRYGYESAMNGRGVKVTGGGVAQVASALYLAIKQMDCITVLDKSTYTNFNQSYVSNPSDAILVDYQDDVDFTFRYDGLGTLSIYTYVSDGTLYCEVVEN